MELEIYSLVKEPIEEGYKNNDLKQVLDYINILPAGSTMRMFSMVRYQKFINPHAFKNPEKNNDQTVANS